MFRSRLPNVERPYKCLGYPVVPIVYCLVLAVVAVSTLLNQPEAKYGVYFILVGGAVYALFLRGERG